MDERRRLLELMRERAFERRTVTLASGRVSDFYIDCKQVVLSAEGHALCGSLLFERIRAEAPEAEAVGGMTMGADPLVSATSTVSWLRGRPLSGFYVRKEPKGHGTGAWIEGLRGLREGAPVAIVEDVVTTGASLLAAAARARDAGLRPVRALALVDRQEGGREAIEREMPLSALFSRSDFLP